MENILKTLKKWQQARNQKTRVEILSKLSEENNSLILREIASNPNSPSLVLSKLCADYPERVDKNPSLPIIFMENPNFLEQVYFNSFDTLVSDVDLNETRVKPLPNFFINKGIKHRLSEIRALIADNIFTPPNILAELSSDPNIVVRVKVAQNFQTPFLSLKKLANDSKKEVRLALANNLKTPKSILSQLAEDPDFLVRACVAKNVNTPAEALNFLAQDIRKEVRLGLACNRKCPFKILDFLSHDSDYLIRFSSRSNPKLRVIQSIFGR